MNVPVNKATIDLLSRNIVEGIVSSYHVIRLDIPSDYLHRKEPGTMMGFNVGEVNLEEAVLSATNIEIVESNEEGRSILDVTVTAPYIKLFLPDIKKVQDAYIVVDDTAPDPVPTEVAPTTTKKPAAPRKPRAKKTT